MSTVQGPLVRLILTVAHYHNNIVVVPKRGSLYSLPLMLLDRIYIHSTNYSTSSPVRDAEGPSRNRPDPPGYSYEASVLGSMGMVSIRGAVP